MKPKRQNQLNQQKESLRKPQKRQSNNTSWGKVANWYDDYLKDEDNYQNKVILPNLLRLLDLDSLSDDSRILDIGCGQGFFIDKIINSTNKYINIYGLDLGSDLISIAKDNLSKYDNVVLENADAANMKNIKSDSIDLVYSVLALQNMKDLDKVVSEISRVLKNGKRAVLVINHPAFRIPKDSDWYFDNNFRRQGRVVYNYMSDKKYAIDMNPGQKALSGKNEQTFSFHHPLQYFSKLFYKNNLAILKIEEWMSHKKSQPGPKQQAEDNARKEIPMFMCLELINIAK